MNYLKIDKTSISNGLGIRTVLWCAGCERRCKNCFNPQTWDFNAGQLFDENAKQRLFAQLCKPYVKGLTLSGGHPLEPKNIDDVYQLLLEIKYRFPDKDIWLYTGYYLEMLNFTTYMKGTSPDGIYYNTLRDVLSMCDVIVDGPYVDEQRDITLAFRGSRNQRLIDVKETLKQGKIITLQNN